MVLWQHNFLQCPQTNKLMQTRHFLQYS